MSPRLVVWDFDGTLADSMAAGLGIFNRLAGELGFKPVEDPALARTMSSREFMKVHGITLWRLPRLVRHFRAAAAAVADQLVLFPGLAEVLEGFRDRGVRLGILSSNREDNIRRCLRANGAEEHFAFVVGYPKLFGKAKALRRILRKEGVDRAEAIYIGDEARDVEAARAVGVAVAAVTWGFHEEAILRASGPTHLVREPRHLLDLLGPQSEGV